MGKILIVEDEALIAMDIKSKLLSFGYSEIVYAVRPEDAMKEIEKEVPSLVLMDINLKSDLDGIDLAGIINTAYRIPIVFLTSYSDISTMDRASEAAPYGYIVKPVDTQSLYSVVSMAIRRAAVERNLVEQNGLFEAVLENSAEGIVVADETLKIKYFNHIFMEIFGIERGDIYGEDVDRVITDIEPSLRGFVPAVLEGRESSARRLDILRNGKQKTVFMNISSFSLDGETTRYLFIFSDLSELERMKNELDTTARNFDEIFEKSRDALVLLKIPEHTVSDLNPAAEKMFGFRKMEMLGKVPEELIRVLAVSGCILGDSGQDEAVCVMTRLTGETFTFLANSQRLSIGGTEYLYLSLKDITEAKKLEKRERQLQEKLIQTNKMTALGTLVSGIAHEINNPNNFIMFNSKMMLDLWKGFSAVLDRVYEREGDFEIENLPYSVLREDIPKLLEGIAGGSERIKKIVHELKTFSRGDTENMDDRISIDEVVASAVKILNQHILRYTAHFSAEVVKPVPYFKGNRQKVEQVLINLILNALEALKDKNGAVRLVCSADESGNLKICVSDTGVGIPGDIIRRITEPFFTTKLKDGGTGLGLSIVYTYVKEHKGELDFFSEPEKGTSVTVTFPAQG
ncbi:PAS domain S-box protein [Geovibrio thiophilus]|uniref:histidine kinase n=1 Tax=Geovibrio thiophilus TaxID=139438 RepID=A0A410JWN5_9BACT|nr:ATP-binding protein [Geovibrio thiophilus]QAR32469.1 PAS domain S-box protein [Geovibrio thiophilus]